MSSSQGMITNRLLQLHHTVT